jgi:hypothetical protein
MYKPLHFLIFLSHTPTSNFRHEFLYCVFILTDKVRVKGGGETEGVGVMKDKELKLEETQTSHTQDETLKYT